MSAIIRVKRHRNEEPLDALILNCKKRKLDETNAAEATGVKPISAVLKFAGTLQSQEEDIISHIKNNANKRENVKEHFVDIRKKVREDFEQASRNNRFKVVNLQRELDERIESDEKELITILDIEPQIVLSDDSSKFVYDLYYTTSDDLGDFYEHNDFSVEPMPDLVYGSYRDNGLAESDNEESDDSNDENNWRNDYPDEDDAEQDIDIDSVTEDDMVHAVKQLDFDNLSSDEGEEGFVYSIDSEAAGFEEDIDESDVNRYGERYARFKARYKDPELNSDASYCGYDEDLVPEDDN